ncbi:LysR family transcriptional regulator, partial [Acinetobacter baumannii]|nr:LysR family transcriptional regulator [Acinetobacter baumannii]
MQSIVTHGNAVGRYTWPIIPNRTHRVPENTPPSGSPDRQ